MYREKGVPRVLQHSALCDSVGHFVLGREKNVLTWSTWQTPDLHPPPGLPLQALAKQQQGQPRLSEEEQLVGIKTGQMANVCVRVCVRVCPWDPVFS